MQPKLIKDIKEENLKIPDEFISICDSIYEVNEETVEEIFKKIENYGKDTESFITTIKYAIKIRPKQAKSLNQLLKRIEKNNYEETKLENADDIIEAIQNDNIDLIIKKTSDPSFNPNMKIERVFMEEKFSISLMQLMCFYGSIKCFKYALIDGSFDETDLEIYAIAGGNKEIINILEQKGITFEKTFDSAFFCHRSELRDWLENNKDVKGEIDVIKAIKSFNYKDFNSELINPKNEETWEDEYYFYGAMLLAAIQVGNFCVLKFLIEECKASFETDDYNTGFEIGVRGQGDSLLHIAADYGQKEIIKYLVSVCDIDVEGENNVGFRFRYEGEGGLAPIHIALKKKDIKTFKFLVEECRASVNHVADEFEKLGETGINGYTPVHFACAYNDLELLKYLVEKYKADVNKVGEEGITAFHVAVEKGHLDVIKYLVEECHVNSNEKDKEGDGWYPLHYASESGNLELVKYLVEKCHANLNVKDFNGWTALGWAQDNVKEYLISKGAK